MFVLAGGLVVLGWWLKGCVNRARGAVPCEQSAPGADERVLVFRALLAAARTEGVSRAGQIERMVHGAVACIGASSGAFFESTAEHQLSKVVVAGMFPCVSPIDPAVRATFSTRAKLIEYVLQTEVRYLGDGWVARIAESGRGELLPEVPSDHELGRAVDPAWTVRSVMGVPTTLTDGTKGVLVLANSTREPPFSALDFDLLQRLAEVARAV